MDLSIKEISIENEKINRDKFFSVGFCPEMERYLLCVHISWVVGYDRYYAIDAEDIMLYEESPDEFCQKYAKEINAYRTERLLGAGALRDYDFRCLPDEAMKEIYRVLKPNGTLFAPTFLWKEGKQRKMIKSLMSILGFKMYQEWDKKEFEDFIKEYGFSVVEMKLAHGGLAPIGVMIAQKVA